MRWTGCAVAALTHLSAHTQTRSHSCSRGPAWRGLKRGARRVKLEPRLACECVFVCALRECEGADPIVCVNKPPHSAPVWLNSANEHCLWLGLASTALITAKKEKKKERKTSTHTHTHTKAEPWSGGGWSKMGGTVQESGRTKWKTEGKEKAAVSQDVTSSNDDQVQHQGGWLFFERKHRKTKVSSGVSAGMCEQEWKIHSERIKYPNQVNADVWKCANWILLADRQRDGRWRLLLLY